jgi:opacity protein-like surface antigen
MKVALSVVLLAAAASSAHADRRSFTRTYEYMTMPEGETELELYTTQSQADYGHSAEAFALQLEVEHGITNRWDFSIAHGFDQVSGVTGDDDRPFGLRDIKLHTRYRLEERGEWPVDVQLHAEGGKLFGDQIYEGSGRLILARDLDKLAIAANASGDVVHVREGETATEISLGWAAGATYDVFPEIKLGAEAWGDYLLDTEEGVDPLRASAGPALSWAPATSLWVTLTAGFGITENADDLSVRGAVGLHL